ncbi:MAG TPA: allophanate hydrolase [Steroidobacteraceae bacterium]|jgi:allophanate hydrolase|nr:allophanate hydrolase [Steroidobacteraceae bacterium]
MSLDLTISALAAAYRSRAMTPAALVEKLLVARREHAADNIWVSEVGEDALRARARELADIDPQSLPLYGIPFAIKDNIDFAALPTTAGCAAFAYEPASSAPVVQALIDAGAIALGKTNLDQFATGLVGTRSPYGICRNAFDPAYISGGSSSGSAVAVALGIASFSLGTDTAGSGRVPAAFNNLIGYKPTLGSLSMRGVVPACRSLDAMSIFALTAEDAARVARVAVKFDAEDAWSRAVAMPARRGWGRGAAFRFAVPRAAQLEFFGNTAYSKLFDASVARLRDLGGAAHEVDIEPLLETARLLYEGPWVAERYLATEALLNSQPEAMLDVTRRIIQGGITPKALDAFRAQYRLKDLLRQAQGIWTSADFLLLPTAGTHYRIADEQADPIRLNSTLGRYTNFVNLMDLAAVAVPAGFTPERLPFGVSLIASAWSDADLLAMAGRLHRAAGSTIGATSLPLPVAEPAAADASLVDVMVCGAHMSGLPLNKQLLERGAWRIAATRTAPNYRFFALPGGPPFRPGLVQVKDGGVAIDVEVWRMPVEHFGSFVAGIPAPLGIGKVKLEDGSAVSGFLCESLAVGDASDISSLGGWRQYLAAKR